MSLEIVNINKNGDASQEYILFRATETINMNSYAVVDKTFDEDGNVSNVFRHFYRFPSQQVKKGEYVCLFTKKGTYSLGKMTNGDPVHKFYWGSEAPIWNDSNVESAEVLKVETVNKKTTGHPAPKKKTTFILRPNGGPRLGGK